MDILVLQQILNHRPPAISLEEFSVVISQDMYVSNAACAIFSTIPMNHDK